MRNRARKGSALFRLGMHGSGDAGSQTEGRNYFAPLEELPVPFKILADPGRRLAAVKRPPALQHQPREFDRIAGELPRRAHTKLAHPLVSLALAKRCANLVELFAHAVIGRPSLGDEDLPREVSFFLYDELLA